VRRSAPPMIYDDGGKMKEYASTITLEINGQKFEDFSSFTEGEIPLNQEVKLMNGSGVASVVARYGFSLDYVMPKIKAERLDWTTVKDAVVTVVFPDGSRTIYTSCNPLKVGEGKLDGETASTRTIPFVAGNRREE